MTVIEKGGEEYLEFQSTTTSDKGRRDNENRKKKRLRRNSRAVEYLRRW